MSELLNPETSPVLESEISTLADSTSAVVNGAALQAVRNTPSRPKLPIRSRDLNVLFIHQNFPGQFRQLAPALARQPGMQVRAIARSTAPNQSLVPTARYTPGRTAGPHTHHYLRLTESGVLHGQAVLRTMQSMLKGGYKPDVVIAHPGWGETLFVKEMLPDARLIHLCEFYYQTQGSDVGFDPEFPATIDDRLRIRMRNAMHLLNLENCDVAVSPTHWQKSLHPAAYADKISVIHEGIDCDALQPDPKATFTLPNGVTLKKGDKVVTFVSRNLEPYRGFHIFMRMLPELLKAQPDAQVLIVGGDGVSYGKKPKDFPNWREKMLAGVPIDSSRVHFLGTLPYAQYRRVLQISAAHVYLTYPFVLSWSMLEAMASGCVVIGSATAPVCEVISDGVNGLLVDFFDTKMLAKTIVKVLENPRSYQAISQCARNTVKQRYGIEAGISAYRNLVDMTLNVDLVSGQKSFGGLR